MRLSHYSSTISCKNHRHVDIQKHKPLGVHIEHNGFIAGGIDDGPESVLVDLGDLADGSAGSLQAGIDLEGSIPTGNTNAPGTSDTQAL